VLYVTLAKNRVFQIQPGLTDILDEEKTGSLKNTGTSSGRFQAAESNKVKKRMSPRSMRNKKNISGKEQ
jgi:hypothetical protein